LEFNNRGDPNVFSLPLKDIVKCIVGYESVKYWEPATHSTSDSTSWTKEAHSDDDCAKGGMGKTTPWLDERVMGTTRHYGWKRKESVALVSEMMIHGQSDKKGYLFGCTSSIKRI
jgi:hypothetical protein